MKNDDNFVNDMKVFAQKYDNQIVELKKQIQRIEIKRDEFLKLISSSSNADMMKLYKEVSGIYDEKTLQHNTYMKKRMYQQSESIEETFRIFTLTETGSVVSSDFFNSLIRLTTDLSSFIAIDDGFLNLKGLTRMDVRNDIESTALGLILEKVTSDDLKEWIISCNDLTIFLRFEKTYYIYSSENVDILILIADKLLYFYKKCKSKEERTVLKKAIYPYYEYIPMKYHHIFNKERVSKAHNIRIILECNIDPERLYVINKAKSLLLVENIFSTKEIEKAAKMIIDIIKTTN